MKASNEKIEHAKAWQLAKKISLQVRKAVSHVPYEEHYIFSTPPVQYSVQLTTSIAMALGKGTEAAYDWRYGRGQLFAIKGLLIMGQELGSIKPDAALMSDLDALQALIEAEIAKDEAAHTSESSKK